MTPSTSTSPTTTPVTQTSGDPGSELVSSQGRTSIADAVVQKVAGVAAREISGVYAVGGGSARALGAIKDRMPGTASSAGSGITVEVGERQAAVDLTLVVEYGVSIVDVAQAVRRNVISSIEAMTGLEVTEVNVNVNDVHLPSEEPDPEPARVQ